MRRIVVGVSGSSGAAYGVRLIEVLADQPDIETHVVVTAGAARTIEYETGRRVDDAVARADVVYDDRALGAAIASGTFQVDGMVVAPCSMKTLSAVAHSYSDGLLCRAADVCLSPDPPMRVVTEL